MPRQRRLMNQINVVPFIDVMLVLLIVFMVAAPLINPGQIELPSVGLALKPPIAPMEVILQADKKVFLRDRAHSGARVPMDRASLIQAIREKQARAPDQAVVISADKNVRYEEVLKLMDMLSQNQVAKVGLLAKPSGQ